MSPKEPERLQCLLSELDRMDEYAAWWPAMNDYEVLVGAVLTQNTNWKNVEKALANFARPIQPEDVLDLSEDLLEERLRPSGFYKRKASTLKELTVWYMGKKESHATPEDTGQFREELLCIRGIGKETADAVLNFGLGLPILVVDVYTRRICGRFGIQVPDSYDDCRLLLQEILPRNAAAYATFHARIVELAKMYCRKKPLCAECPLSACCRKRSV